MKQGLFPDRNKTGCSRPLLTYKYSHSQYLSLQREGTVNGSVRTINLFLRAQGSGHIRLEHALPPAMDALFEVSSEQRPAGTDSNGHLWHETVRDAGVASIDLAAIGT